ncbi:invasion associated locus B family protein [Halomonas beimenensis]|uniref:Invasion associated locus B family protein n=1 Tax=Halomonas beimenensis TaxID=475662 RepID=A0A291P4I2_9GAMM|nr:invasion associated locus B family protein [Halomonas beimenensis]ATJ81779.1 invasion associated locus B family protein [Halomonas beimenensis]
MFKRLASGLTGLLTLMVLVSGAQAQTSVTSEDARRDYRSERFQRWEVRCPPEGQSGPCSMTQLISAPDGNQPLMRVIIAQPPQVEQPIMTFLLPLGVRLAPGLQLSVDGGEGIGFPYQVCQQPGCRADLPLEPSLLQSLRGGSTATLSLIGPRGNRRDLDISLMGFTAASERITP